jgi:hypothetical protein
MATTADARGRATTPLSGAQLTDAYLRRLARDKVPTAQLTAAADENDLLTGAFPGGFLPRPVFLDADELAGLTADLRMVHRMIGALPDRLFGGSHAAFVREVGVTPIQQAVTTRAFNGTLPMLSRYDLYRSADGFKILESNVTSSLGGFQNAEINRAMLSHPALGDFAADNDLTYVDTLRGLVATMLAECGDAVRGDRPTVALVDWPDSFVSYGPKLRSMAALMADLGVDAVACHVGQLRERGGRLEVEGRAVDIVYRFFVVKEIQTQQDADLLEPILRAAERGDVGVFIPIGVDTYGSKAALAMLSDERHRSAVSDEERACLDRIMPWSRPLRRTGTDPDGQEVDLVDYVTANQHELILKPSLDYGGSGIVPGWTVEAAQWSEQVSELAQRGGYIVQRRVRPLPEPFPVAGQDTYEDMYVNWGMFLVDADATDAGGYGGCLLRATADPEVGVVNMSSGARAGCCFHSTRELS